MVMSRVVERLLFPMGCVPTENSRRALDVQRYTSEALASLGWGEGNILRGISTTILSKQKPGYFLDLWKNLLISF